RSLDAAAVTEGRPASRASGAAPALTREELYARALTFLPFFEAFAPHLVEEIRGIAEGADVAFAAALLVNVRPEVAGVTRITAVPSVRRTVAAAAPPAAPISGAIEGCTSFAAGREATAQRTVLMGQNQDQAPEMEA